MAGSLRDQLLKAGMVDKKKAKQSQHQKHQSVKKQRQAQKSGQAVEQNTPDQQFDQAAREKRQRDLALNKQRDQAMQQKALIAQIRQIISQHLVAVPKQAELEYHFEHDKAIKKIIITEQQQEQLARGQLAIAFSDDRYQLIPDKIAARIVDKIDARLDETLVIRIHAEAVADEDDPYADYPIPDDLNW